MRCLIRRQVPQRHLHQEGRGLRERRQRQQRQRRRRRRHRRRSRRRQQQFRRGEDYQGPRRLCQGRDPITLHDDLRYFGYLSHNKV